MRKKIRFKREKNTKGLFDAKTKKKDFS